MEISDERPGEGLRDTTRLSHLRDVFWLPAWRLASYIIVDLVGAFLTWRDLLVSPADQKLLRIASLPQLDWGWWALLTGLLLFAAVFEGSHKAILKVEKQRNEAQAKLRDIAMGRPIDFENIHLDVTNEKPPTQIKMFDIIFKNHSEKMLKWEMEEVSVEINGVKIPNRAEKSVSGYVSANSTGQFFAGFARPVDVNVFPFVFTIEYTIKYDNLPPLAERRTYRKIQETFLSFEPMKHRNLVLAQDER